MAGKMIDGGSSGEDLLSKFADSIDLAKLTPKQVRQRIELLSADEQDDQWPAVQVVSAEIPNVFLPGIDAAVKLQIETPLGDYAFSHARQIEARVIGNVGLGLGDGMSGGVLRVRGNAGHGAGVSMSGGTIAIYGSAADRTAAAMKGGGVFVRGNVGNQCGYAATGGTLVIGGDAGEDLGLAAKELTIFIRGKAGSLAPGMTEAPLRKQALLQLGVWLMNASIRGEATDFRRIITVEALHREQAGRGEVNPSWR